MIFDTISVKACWERWCRWNCDQRVTNAWKRRFLSYRKCHYDAQIMWLYAYYVTLGSRCKMANSSSEDETDTFPKRPTRIQPYQFKLSGRILKEYRNIVSASKQTPCGIPWGLQIALTEMLTTQMGVVCSAARKSARLNCINLIHFRLTAGRLCGSSCIVIPGVVCELLQCAATQ